MNRIGYGFFQFSKEQLDNRTKIEARIGKEFIAGKVVVKGKQKTFTQITKIAEHKYNDSKIVARGDLETMSFTEPYSY